MNTTFDEHTLKTTVHVDMQDILSNMQHDWMVVFTLFTLVLFVYVIFNTFVLVKDGSIYAQLKDELQTIAIVASVFQVVLMLTYWTGYKGI